MSTKIPFSEEGEFLEQWHSLGLTIKTNEKSEESLFKIVER